jgi:hypothetical protein
MPEGLVTGALLERPASIPEPPVPGGGVTLEERLNAILHDARTNRSTECPLCHARMAPAAAGAACGSCGSSLS